MKVLKFFATWCSPCKMLSATLENMNLPIEVIEVDIDKEPELAKKYNVRGVPTMVLISGDQEIRRFIGAGDMNRIQEFFKV